MRTRRGRYAEGSKVPEERSRAELQKEIQRFGATHFVIGEEPTRVHVGFQVTPAEDVATRRVRFSLELPQMPPDSWTSSQLKGDRYAERRRRWRCLILLVKAKLTAVEDGIATFDEEFLSHIILPSGKTVGETIIGDLDTAITGGTLPALMPGME